VGRVTDGQHSNQQPVCFCMHVSVWHAGRHACMQLRTRTVREQAQCGSAQLRVDWCAHVPPLQLVGCCFT
jgi:hypothetical protein